MVRFCQKSATRCTFGEVGLGQKETHSAGNRRKSQETAGNRSMVEFSSKEAGISGKRNTLFEGETNRKPGFGGKIFTRGGILPFEKQRKLRG